MAILVPGCPHYFLDEYPWIYHTLRIPMVGQPAARPDANLESLWKSEQGSTPEPYIFLKLDDKAVPTRGRSWVVRDACSSNKRWSTFFFKIVWAFYGRDLTGFYQSFVKVILKSGSAAGIIEKSRKRNACDQLWDAHSTALPQSYPASIGSAGGILLEMWIFWDGRMLDYGLAGRSQNVLFNLYLLDTKIEYKKNRYFL